MDRFHERLAADEPDAASSDRGFGLVMAAALAVLAGIVAWQGSRAAWGLLAAAVLVGAVAWRRASLLAPANRLWTRFGLILHRLVSPIVLGVVFFLVLTPMALLMRAFGKRPLELGFRPDLASYWIDRGDPGPAPESMKDQF